MNSKFFVFLVALGLGVQSQAQQSQTQDPQPKKVASIRGQVSKYSGRGEGVVTMLGQKGALATANIDKEGNFELALPNEEALSEQLVNARQLLAPAGCSGDLHVSEDDAKGYATATLQAAREDLNGLVYAGTLTRQFLSASYKGNLWIYLSKAANLKGDLDCTNLLNIGIPVHVKVDIDAKAGWNVATMNAWSSISFSGIRVEGTLIGSEDKSTVWRTSEELKSLE